MKETIEGTITVEDNGATIVGIGELDLGIGDEFDAALAEAAASGEQVTVDFRGVDFIDSAILQSLATHGRTIDKRGDQLRIIVASGSYPQYVLRVVGFDCLMDIVVEEKISDSNAPS